METVEDFNIHSSNLLDKEKIVEIYSNWKKAIMNNNIQFLENFYSDDFTATTSTGIIKNKSEVITRLRFKDVEYLTWEDSSILIDIKDDNAILKSLQILNIGLYGLPIKINREIMLTFERLYDNGF